MPNDYAKNVDILSISMCDNRNDRVTSPREQRCLFRSLPSYSNVYYEAIENFLRFAKY